MGNNRRYAVMSFGLGGSAAELLEESWRGDGSLERCHLSGYSSPDSLQKEIDAGRYLASEMEGCLLIDKVPALNADWTLAVRAPMSDPRLADGEKKRFADLEVDPVLAAMMAEGFGVVGVAAVQAKTDSDFIGLDDVSPTAYAAWWKDHGARLGMVVKGRVVWEE